jgi:hypothetical protein
MYGCTKHDAYVFGILISISAAAEHYNNVFGKHLCIAIINQSHFAALCL